MVMFLLFYVFGVWCVDESFVVVVDICVLYYVVDFGIGGLVMVMVEVFGYDFVVDEVIVVDYFGDVMDCVGVVVEVD